MCLPSEIQSRKTEISPVQLDFACKSNQARFGTLDVGSGNKPLKEADVLCEKFLTNNKLRGDQAVVFDGKLFVLADAEALPFRNKAFDFVYCNRVIEYAEKPEHMIEELKRVGVSGYVCTPSMVFPNHYGAYCRKEKIIFVPRTKPRKTKNSTKCKGKILFQGLLRLIGFITGIYITEIFWGNGKETFSKCYKSNNKELKSVPLLLVKLLVTNRKMMEDLRDKIIW